MATTSADQPVPYMERTRLYYRALGYESDYVWATFADVPFARLHKPLAEAKIALLTTASPPDRGNVDSSGGSTTRPDQTWRTRSLSTLPRSGGLAVVSRAIFASASGLCRRAKGTSAKVAHT